MLIFFDTEFTGLHKNTTLIALGCIDENGRTFYAELTDYDRSQCNDWINENVLAHLRFNSKEAMLRYSNDNQRIEVKGDKEYVGYMLKHWLHYYGDEPIQFVSDVCHYDMVLLIDLFGTAFDLPENISPSCHDINQDIANYYNISEKEAFDKSRESIIEVVIDGDKHNALYDAEVIRWIYAQVINRKPQD